MSSYTVPHLDRSVLLTIDVQRDFALPGGAAEILGTAEVLPAIRTLVQAFREKERPIVHVVRLYLEDGSNAELCRREGFESGRTFVVPGSLGSELVDEVLPDPSIRLDPPLLVTGALQTIGPMEWIMFKPRWGAFYSTGLEDHLRRLDVNTVVVAGCNFPNCPRTTIYEASERDFRLVLAPDAVSGLNEQGRRELARIGTHYLDSEDFQTWGAGKAS